MSKGFKLYELSDKYEQVLDMVANGDLALEDVEDTLEALKDQFEIKAENIGKIIIMLNGYVDSIDNEIKRLKDRKDHMKNSVANMKDYLKYNFQRLGVKKVSGSILDLRLQKNPPSVNILDETKIPIDFMKIIPEERKPDKKAILDAYKNGQLIDGIEIIQDESIRIK